METIQNLIEILESQCVLYSEILEIMESEKNAVVKWRFQDTFDLTKKKDTLIYKEKILDEARAKAVRKLESEFGEENLKISDIISLTDNEEQNLHLTALHSRLKLITDRLQDENLSLKILYRTNMSFIEDLFSNTGLGSKTVYGINRTYSSVRTSTLDHRG